MKRRILSERNGVVVLFFLVVVIFSLAQKDTKVIDRIYFNNPPSAQTVDKATPPEVKSTAEKVISVAPGAFQ